MSVYLSRGQYVNGEWVRVKGRGLQSINPANDLPLWEGEMASDEVVAQGFNAAKAALPGWSSLRLEARLAYLERFMRCMNARLDALCEKLAEETGKPLWEVTGTLKSLPNKLKLSLAAFEQRSKEAHFPQTDHTLKLRFKPLGVVAIFGAFNFPIHLSYGHLLPALLAGNTAILKPSELTPAIHEYFMQCWEESGLPAGVLNLLQGDGQTAQTLLEQDLQGVYFTGSYQTGCVIQSKFQARPEVLIALEMGGNNPLIVDESCDIDTAVYQALISSYITAGQRCTCTRRLILPKGSFGKQFISRFIERAEQLRIGAFNDTPAPFMGPVIRRTHALKHLEKQQTRIEEGGKSLLKMQLKGERGAFLTPGVMDMQNAHTFSDEELFAPLVQVYYYSSFNDALKLANQTQYGLAAGLFSEDASRYQAFEREIKAGVLAWNRPTTGASSLMPFGGVGRSGNHRPTAFYASDYCVYPVACHEQPQLTRPEAPLPGISL